MRPSLAALGLVLAASAVLVPGGHAASGAGPVANAAPAAGAAVTAPGSAAVSATARTAGTSQPVLLARHEGSVTGNGTTVFIANRTKFRPGAGSVHLPPRLRGRSWAGTGPAPGCRRRPR